MIRQLTRTQMVRLTFSAGVLAATWSGLRLLPAAQPPADAELTALKAERASLRTVTDTAREHWEKQAAAVALPQWTTRQLAEFPDSLPSGWNWRKQAHSASITRTETPFAEWPQILVLLQRLEQTPGLTVVKVDVQAEGRGHDRRFSAIAIAVLIAVAPNGNPEHAAFLGPLPVSRLVDSPRLAGGRATAASLTGPAGGPVRRTTTRLSSGFIRLTYLHTFILFDL